MGRSGSLQPSTGLVMASGWGLRQACASYLGPWVTVSGKLALPARSVTVPVLALVLVLAAALTTSTVPFTPETGETVNQEELLELAVHEG